MEWIIIWMGFGVMVCWNAWLTIGHNKLIDPTGLMAGAKKPQRAAE